MLRQWVLRALLLLSAGVAQAQDVVELRAAELEDRIQGGLLGQILGNLNGLPHEFKYLDQPGDVVSYTPSLPDGGRTDDDTDIEWVYIIESQRSGKLYIPSARMSELWKAHINDWMWSSADYARQLMDIGIDPPLTGHVVLNPWAETNVAGLFLTEMYSLASPAMPQSASRLATYYARTAVDREPIQAAQLCSTMVSLAFVEHDIEKLLAAGRAAVDPKSEIAEIVDFTIAQWRAHPNDWRATRLAIRDRYTRYGGLRPDMNGHALNTGATVAALLYGKGDFVETLRLAFSLGWDADNSAAMCGTIIGVIKGKRWFDAQGWHIVDRYHNDANRRPGLPIDETMTGYGRRLLEVAGMVVREAGGQVAGDGDARVYRIVRQSPKNLEPIYSYEQCLAQLREQLLPTLERDLTRGRTVAAARAVYVAVAIGESTELYRRQPRAWESGVQHLERIAPGLIVALYKAPKPYGKQLRAAAVAAGLAQPRE